MLIDGKGLEYKPYKDSRGENGFSGQLYLTESGSRKYLVKTGKADVITDFAAHRLAMLTGVPSSEAVLIVRNRNVYVGIEYLDDFKKISMDDFLGTEEYEIIPIIMNGKRLEPAKIAEMKYPDDSPLLADLMKYFAFREMTAIEDVPQLAISCNRLVSYDYAEAFYLDDNSITRMIATGDISYPLHLFKSHLHIVGSLSSNLKVIRRPETEFLSEAYFSPLYDFLDSDYQPIIDDLSEVFPHIIPQFFVEAFNAIKQEIVGE